MSAPTPFHLAFAVTDIDATREFYVNKLGCKMGRSAERWIDFDFFGHQISAHLVDGALSPAETNPVDGEKVPSRHFGVILEWHDWHAMKDRLVAENTKFIIEPTTRFAGEVGEQATMFFRDPSGNALEFKTFRDSAMIFAN
jgi:extradiol dioxygenase family protein